MVADNESTESKAERASRQRAASERPLTLQGLIDLLAQATRTYPLNMRPADARIIHGLRESLKEVANG
jgi:predicted dienelactone hydrolase